MTDPLDQIARICAEAPEDALSRIADVLGFKEQQAEPVGDERALALQDMAYAHGLQRGWQFGVLDDRAGYEKCLAAYDGYVKVLRETRAAQSGQRAEPVGDALEFRVRDAIQGIANCIADPMWTGHAEVSKANLKRWHKALHDLLAAQSGQRAGVAELREIADNITANAVTQPKTNWGDGYRQACADIAGGLRLCANAAAPTQQQERSDGGAA